jgi:hypothetical protein
VETLGLKEIWFDDLTYAAAKLFNKLSLDCSIEKNR